MPFFFIRFGGAGAGAGQVADPRAMVLVALFAFVSFMIAIFDLTFDIGNDGFSGFGPEYGDSSDTYSAHVGRVAPLLPPHRWQFVYRPERSVVSTSSNEEDDGDNSGRGIESEFEMETFVTNDGQVVNRRMRRNSGRESISGRLFDSFMQYFFANSTKETSATGTLSSSSSKQTANGDESGSNEGAEQQEGAVDADGDGESQTRGGSPAIAETPELHEKHSIWNAVPPWIHQQQANPDTMQFDKLNMPGRGVWYFLAVDHGRESQATQDALFVTVVYPRLYTNTQNSATWEHARLEGYALVDDTWVLTSNSSILGQVTHVARSPDGHCIALSVLNHDASGVGSASLTIQGHCLLGRSVGWKPFRTLQMPSTRPITALDILRHANDPQQLCIVTAQRGDRVIFRQHCINVADAESSVLQSEGPAVQEPTLLWDDIVALQAIDTDHVFGLKLHGSFSTVKKRLQQQQQQQQQQRRQLPMPANNFDIPLYAVSYSRVRGDPTAMDSQADEWKRERHVELLQLGKRLLSNSMGLSPHESILFGRNLIERSSSNRLAAVTNLKSAAVLFSHTGRSSGDFGLDYNVLDYSDYVQTSDDTFFYRLQYFDLDAFSIDSVARMLQQYAENALSSVSTSRIAVSDRFESVAIVQRSVVLVAMKMPDETELQVHYRIELRKSDAANPSLLQQLHSQRQQDKEAHHVFGYATPYTNVRSQPDVEMDLSKNLDIAAVQFVEPRHASGNDSTQYAELHLLVMYVDGTIVRYNLTPDAPNKFHHATAHDTDFSSAMALAKLVRWIAKAIADKWRLFMILSFIIGVFIANELSIRRRIRQQQQRQQQQQAESPHED